MELLDAARVLVCTYSPPPRSTAVLLFADAPWLSVIEEDASAYTPPPQKPAVLPSMELLDAVRVLACTNNPPPSSAAVLLLADAPWLSMIEEEDRAYTPPPLSPAALPSMELFDAVKVLFQADNPPPSSPAVLPSMELFDATSMLPVCKYTPPPSLAAALPSIELLKTVRPLPSIE
jgi:hypothetical protein